MIIKAKHHWFLDPFFRYYVLQKMKRMFHSCHITGNVHDKGLPVLLVCNHTSWWDGIWTLYLNQQLFGRKYHFMMLKENLQKNWYFKYTGGFSVEKNSRSVVETIDYTALLLAHRNNMVLMFPQGEIQSLYTAYIQFEQGIEKILKRTTNPVQVVFVANLPEYHSHTKPVVNSYLANYDGSYDTHEIETAYNRFLQESLETQRNKKG